MSRIRRLCMVMTVLALLLVGLAAPAQAGGGGGCHGDFQDASTTAVEAGKNCFVPTVARVEVGDTVTWTNVDPVPHTATGAGGVFDAGDFLEGGTATATFDEAGVYPYACLLHPGMVGAVVVGNGARAGRAGAAQDDAGGPAAAPDEPAAAAVPDEPAAVPAADFAMPWRSVLVVAIALALSLAAVLFLRRRSPSPSV